MISAAFAIALSSAAIWIAYRAAVEVTDIDYRTEADLRDAFPAANPQPPAESTQETAASTASR